MQPNGSLWGVLVANTKPTTSNALLPYLRAQRRVLRAHGADDAVRDGNGSGAAHVDPQTALFRQVPAVLVGDFYLPRKTRTRGQNGTIAATTTTAGNNATSSNSSNASSASDDDDDKEGHCNERDGGGDSCTVASAVVALLPLHGESVRIGRVHGNDLVLPSNPCISSVHCVLSTSTGDGAEEALVAREGAPPPADDALVAAVEGRPTSDSSPSSSSTSSPPQRLPRDATLAHVEGGAARPVPLRVSLSDVSTNGCLVNGRRVGKGAAHGPLKCGDVVDLMNAGRRHTDEYNLSFTYYDLAGFQEWLRGQERKKSPPPPPQLSSTTATTAVSPEDRESPSTTTTAAAAATGPGAALTPTQKKQLERRARRKALLLRGRWNVAAQVSRMYYRDVEDFYSFCPGADGVLGEGGFGKVFRGALRAAPAQGEAGEAAGFPDSYAEVAAWSAAERARRKEAYVAAKAQEAPAAVLAVQRHARDSCQVGTAAAMGQYPFAIKIINKKRMLLDALDDAADAGGVAPATTEEREALQQLVALESQVGDYAQRRAGEWERLEAQQVLDATAATQASASQLRPGDSLESHPHPALIGGSQLTGGAAPSQPPSLFSPALGPDGGLSQCTQSDTQQQQQQQQRPLRGEAREAARQRLLSNLSPALRKQYERELQQVQRQQCEINVLLSARHPNITRLYEVFDSCGRLSLVMEQALGGEAFDLLQPSAPPTALQSRRGNDGDDDDDDGEAGLYGGGPLPEFLVKIIIVQVLEAVHYLHSMGIVHRDLKLENMLLQRPCRVPAVCALQLEMLSNKLQQYTAQQQPSSRRHGTDPATDQEEAAAAAAVGTYRRVANPLSPLHTVHIPRALWPTVYVTDFGLSRIWEHQQKKDSGAATGTGGGGGDGPSSSGSGEADGTALIYKRNDFMTSCGTPIYAAPEVTITSLRPDRTGYSAAVDLFSVGVIAYALLTGRLPFPKRERQGGRTPAIDYRAPLQFDRSRRTKPRSAATGGDATARNPATSPFAEGEEEMLPPLAIADSFRLPADGPCNGSGSSAAPRGGDRKRGRDEAALLGSWEADMAAVAQRVALVEARRHRTPPATDAAPEPVVFPSAVEATLRAIRRHTARRQAAGREVDLELFVMAAAGASPVATRAAGGGGGSPTATGGSSHGAGRGATVPLPPISPVGQDFLRGLLRLNPTERLTALDALRHPWLQDCRPSD